MEGARVGGEETHQQMDQRGSQVDKDSGGGGERCLVADTSSKKR